MMFIRLRLRKRRLRFLLPGVLLAAAIAATGWGTRTAMRMIRPIITATTAIWAPGNTNPNLPLTGTAWSYRRDNAFAAQLLRGMKGIRDIRITRTGGSHMHVHLKIDKSLSREEAAQLAARAEAVLKENFPRYRVTVDADQE